MLESAQVFNASIIRWMAAIAAAIALHALLLLVPMPTTTLGYTQPLPLQIHLFSQQKSVLSRSSPVQKHAPAQPINNQPTKPPIAVKPLIIPTAQKKSPPVVHTKRTPTTLQPPPPPQYSSHANKDNIQTVSHAVRINILASVHYPKQARRHGWHGTVECQFDVQQHAIHNIIVLVSSDHSILDRAAKRGLQAMDFIHLPNGRYRVPIVFYLR